MNLRNIILILAVFGVAISATAQESWSGLTNWVGKYPTTTKESFFRLPAIQNRLKSLLNKEDFKHLTAELSIETPIQNIKGYLVVKVSLEHCSPCDNAMLALNLKNGAMHVGFYKHESHREIVRWFYSQPQDDPDELPKEIQDEFLYMHEPKI
jgi:hypothetical protein